MGFRQPFGQVLQSTAKSGLKQIAEAYDWGKFNSNPQNALIWENKVIAITDAQLNIIYATENMFAMNRYTVSEVIGKTPKMFQGEKTEAEERKLIQQAITKKEAFESTITNYRKDGSIYKCHIEAYPVFNTKKSLVNFIALENAA